MENIEDGGGCDGECGSDSDGGEDPEPDYGDEDDQIQEQPKAGPPKVKSSGNGKSPIEEEMKVDKKPSVPRAPWRAKKEEKEKAEAAKAPPKKRINKILGSMPTIWEEEETKFFDSNFEYDP